MLSTFIGVLVSVNILRPFINPSPIQNFINNGKENYIKSQIYKINNYY